MPKWGGRFQTADDKLGHTFYFTDAFFPEFPGAWQVLRSTFDHLLLEHSRSCGTETVSYTHLTLPTILRV